jgi:hypothetical protein
MRSRVPDELAADTRARTLLDAHLVRRLSPALNLRLAAQNLLHADTGQRTWLLSLEGKW